MKCGWSFQKASSIQNGKRSRSSILSLILINAPTASEPGRDMTQPSKRFTAYRYLTGPDDAAFCHRVTEALSRGWTLYGSPALTYDSVNKRVICGQALTKEVEDAEYRADLTLGDL